jgi:hypothetical protein
MSDALDTGPKSGRSARILAITQRMHLLERWLAQFWMTRSTIHERAEGSRRSARDTDLDVALS